MFRIGTRQSILAKIQAEGIRDSLQKLAPTRTFEIDAMRTLGDRDKITALYSFEGKNLWTSELEEKLTAGKIDVIVHCLKGRVSQTINTPSLKTLVKLLTICRYAYFFAG